MPNIVITSSGKCINMQTNDYSNQLGFDRKCIIDASVRTVSLIGDTVYIRMHKEANMLFSVTPQTDAFIVDSLDGKTPTSALDLYNKVLAVLAGGITETEHRLSPASQTNNSVSNPDRVLLEDGSDATINSANDWVEASGFSLTSSENISKVEIGAKVRKTGSNETTFTLSYDLSSVDGSTSQQFTITNTELEDKVVDITADRTWAVADIANIDVRLDADVVGSGSRIRPDFIFVKVTTTNA